MKEEHYEENHEVHGAVVLEGFVGWHKPRHVRGWCEQNPAEKGHSKILAQSQVYTHLVMTISYTFEAINGWFEIKHL